MYDNKRSVKIFKALADDIRIRIIELLKDGEMCACTISEALSISQPKLSYHMKILCESGIISCYYIGKWSYYKIDNSGILNATTILKQLMTNDEKISIGCCGKIAI